MILNTKVNYKNSLLEGNQRITKHTIRELGELYDRNLHDIEQQWCCVTLTAVKNIC